MANPNPNPSTRFQAGNPGGGRKKAGKVKFNTSLNPRAIRQRDAIAAKLNVSLGEALEVALAAYVAANNIPVPDDD